MNAGMCDVYAAMLREAGIDIEAAELADEPSTYQPPTPPRSPLREEPPLQLPSFVHLQQLTRDSAHVPYKRLTHFVTHLGQLAGRNWHAGLVTVERRLRKARLKVQDPMAYFRARRLLKRWGYSSPQYRCIFAMLKHMGGPVIRIGYAKEVALRSDFERLSAAYDSARPLSGEGRKNFLSYYLVAQLLLDKYKLRSHYKLPSIKDARKFKTLMSAYLVARPSVTLS